MTEPAQRNRLDPSRRPRRGLVLLLSTLALLCALGATAWVGEDALITLRTIDNLVDGHGPRWNVEERVQTYTHPLWMLLLAGFYFFTREFYFTVTVVGLACSAGAFFLVARVFRDRPGIVVGALLVPFLLSRSLVNFSTSGFENPLTLLLLSCLAALLLRAGRGGRFPWFRISLVAALMGVNRLDTLLLPLAALLIAALQCRLRLPWRRVALGFLPLAAWLLFSLFYYGFPFPNTAPAKLSSALPPGWYLGRGLSYLLLLFRMDLAAGLLLALGSVLGGAALWRWARGGLAQREVASAALGAGLVSYSLYVVSIGGDFIVGRFWTAPLWASLILIALHAPAFWTAVRRMSPRGRAALALGAAALVLLTYGLALHLTLRLFGEASPAGLRSNAHVRLAANLEWKASAAAERFRRIGRAVRESGRPVARIDPVGFAGIEAGRSVLIVDPYGLADPLIARLRPVVESSEIGHLQREIPRGYLLAKQTGSLAGLDPDLAEYVSHLHRISRGPLWSAERLATILRFQLGRYDDLLRRYESRRRPGRPAAGKAGPAAPEAEDRELP